MEGKQIQTQFDEMYFYVRWKDRPFSRPSNWVLIGISQRWAGWDRYCWRISVFGFELSFWFKRFEVQ